MTEKNCPICTENFLSQESLITVKCGHTFHDECLTPWLSLNNTCPNCRFVFPLKNEDK